MSALNAELSKFSVELGKFAATTKTIKNQRDEARAALRDIVHGCEMMQQIPLTGSFAGFVKEVKRVAKQGLES